MSWKERFDPLVRRVSGDRLYLSYGLFPDEYIGRVPTLTPVLDIGFEKPPTFAGIRLTAAKTHPDTGEVHDISLRLVDPENPRKQYHLHGWEDNGWNLYIHHEYRPDPHRIDGEDYAEMIGRLQIHFKPEWGEEYIQGKAPKGLLDVVAKE